MPADADLIARSGDLKQALIAFSERPRFAKVFRKKCRERFGSVVIDDEDAVINFIDFFVLQYKLPDGRKILDHFVEAHPNLSNAERELLLGWHDVLEGVFEVQQHDGEAMVAVNLIDELTYRIRSNMGPGVFTHMPPGSFAIARLVPVGDEWLLSGGTHVLPSSERAAMYRVAAEASMSHPAQVFRNPDKLARAWEIQRRERDRFVEFFGADLIVLPGAQLADRMNRYLEFQVRQAREAAGRSAPAAPAPEFGLPAELLEADLVGVIYDEVEGLNFFAHFGLVEAAFADPDRNAGRDNREAVLGYLSDDSISPLAFRRLAQRYPEGASRLFQKVLQRPSFAWERDGEPLLRQHKPSHFASPPRPSIIPLSDVLAEHVRLDLTDRPKVAPGVF